jgi:Tfp pilus assembly protein PilF
MNGNRIHAFILALVVAASASAMDTPKPEPKDPEKKDVTWETQSLERGRAAIARQDWTGAQALLRQAVERHPQKRTPTTSTRFDAQGPNPMDLVFRHYNEAAPGSATSPRASTWARPT